MNPRRSSASAIARLARIDRGRRVWLADECDSRALQIEQVARDDRAGPPVVEADEIVAAALRKRLDGSIDQDDGHARRGEGVGDAPVHRDTIRRALERREEDAVVRAARSAADSRPRRLASRPAPAAPGPGHTIACD